MTRNVDAILITKREKIAREFANPIKAFSLLRELGIREYRVDAKDWRPEEIAFDRRTRPDRAEALRATHDAYVRGKLEQALAAPQRIYTHAEVMQRADALIAAAETRHAR